MDCQVQNARALSKMEHDQPREWSVFLPDLLHLISKRLPDICDFIRFRAVCKNWHSRVPLSDAPPQFPWLLTHPTTSGNLLRFYSLSDSKLQTISVPESHRKELMGPAKKYIFTSDQLCSSLLLFSPLTGKEILLPPIDLDWCFPICTSLNCTDHVAICGGKTEAKIQSLALYRPGDNKWTVIQMALEGCFVTYHRGLYFVYSPETGATQAVEATSGVTATTVPPPPTKLNCLVESCGELLGIYCDHSLKQDGDCQIYRLHYEEKNCKWFQVNSIHDQILFLEGGQGISISANESIESERNCIFYLGSQQSIKFDGVSTTYYLRKYDIEAKFWEEISLPTVVKPSWFLPNY